MSGSVEEEFRGSLECGILCFEFARALCTGCGQGFVVAFLCKGRGICPSCNGRHMGKETATHLTDHVIPPVPVRQWMISVPKRLRCVLTDRPAAVRAGRVKRLVPVVERLRLAGKAVRAKAYEIVGAWPRRRLSGNNIALARHDFEWINGFDERFVGWGSAVKNRRKRS